jgi:hypothetical protein
MAVAFATKSSSSASAANSIASSSFTPTASAFLVAIWQAEWDGTTGAPSIADTLGGLTWTQITNADDFGFNKMAVWYATAPSSPTAGTVTVTGPTGTGTRRHALLVKEVTGAGVVAQTAFNITAFAATVPVVFGSAPAATSAVLTGLCQENTTAPTIPTGFTADTSQNDGSTTGLITTATKASSVSTSNSWTGAPTNQTLGFAIEFTLGVTVASRGTLIRQNDCAGVSGSAVTTTDEFRSANPFNTITIGTGVFAYSNSVAFHDSIGIRVNTASAAQIVMGRWVFNSTTGDLFLRLYVSRAALSAVNTSLIVFRNSALTLIADLQIVATTGVIQMRNNAGTVIGTAGTVAHSTTGLFRLDVKINPTSGAWSWDLFQGANLESATTSSDGRSGTGAAFGAGNVGAVDLGNGASNNQGAADTFIGNMALAYNAAPGPWVRNESASPFVAPIRIRRPRVHPAIVRQMETGRLNEFPPVPARPGAPPPARRRVPPRPPSRRLRGPAFPATVVTPNPSLPPSLCRPSVRRVWPVLKRYRSAGPPQPQTTSPVVNGVWIPGLCEPARRPGMPVVKRFRSTGVPPAPATRVPSLCEPARRPVPPVLKRSRSTGVPTVAVSVPPAQLAHRRVVLRPPRSHLTQTVPGVRVPPPAVELATRTRPRPAPRRRLPAPIPRSVTVTATGQVVPYEPARFHGIPEGAKRRRRMRQTALPPQVPPTISAVRDFMYFF